MIYGSEFVGVVLRVHVENKMKIMAFSTLAFATALIGSAGYASQESNASEINSTSPAVCVCDREGRCKCEKYYTESNGDVHV